MLRRLGGLLPPSTEQEALEILKIHTIGGVPTPLCPRSRPVRAPHHTSSSASLLSGGIDPRPGEITLAHRELQFLDELPEFRREALEGDVNLTATYLSQSDPFCPYQEHWARIKYAGPSAC